jgi:copper chaperone CopZ
MKVSCRYEKGKEISNVDGVMKVSCRYVRGKKISSVDGVISFQSVEISTQNMHEK